MPPRGQQQVWWTAAIQDQPDAYGDRSITVAAQTTRQLLYLAVPVHRTSRGFLVVPRWGPARRAVEAALDELGVGGSVIAWRVYSATGSRSLTASSSATPGPGGRPEGALRPAGWRR